MKTTIQELNNMRKRCKTDYMIYGCALALGFVLLFLSKSLAAFIVLAGALVCYILVFRPEIKAYAFSWRELYIHSYASRQLSNVIYTYKPDVDALGLAKEQLLPPGPERGYLVRNLVTGQKLGASVELSDATLPTMQNKKPEFISGGRICIRGLKLPVGHMRVFSSEIQPRGYADFVQETLGLSAAQSVAGLNVYTDGGNWEPDEVTIRALKALNECSQWPILIDFTADTMIAFFPHRLVNVQTPALKFVLPENIMDKADYPELGAALHLALVMNQPERARIE